MWKRQGILNDKRPYFRLNCVAQKRLCLSALLTVDEDRQMYCTLASEVHSYNIYDLLHG